MTGTLLLSLAFSAYVVWSIKQTYLHPEDAKSLGYTHKGKLLGATYYCTLPDENGEMGLAGANIVTDQYLPALISSLVMAQNGEFTFDLEEI